MFKFMNGENNLFFVHKKCNYRKGCTVPSINKIKKMHINNEVKPELANFLREYKPEIAYFNGIISTCRQRQNDKCYLCVKDISDEDVVLRRKLKCKNKRDNGENEGRNIDNAIVICNKCNDTGAMNKIPNYIHNGLLLESDGHLIAESVNVLISMLERNYELTIESVAGPSGLTGVVLQIWDFENT